MPLSPSLSAPGCGSVTAWALYLIASAYHREGSQGTNTAITDACLIGLNIIFIVETTSFLFNQLTALYE